MFPVPGLTIFSARALHQEQHAHALAEGCKVHGIPTIRMRYGERAATKMVACWGWRIGRQLRAAGHDVLVMERGYLGDRFAWTSLGWNGLNGRARFNPKDDPERFAANFGGTMNPWKSDGDYVLLIGQVPGDASLGGMDLSRWYTNTARVAGLAYGKPVRFRPHPMAIKRGVRQRVDNAPTLEGTLEEALAGAAVCVTFNSNTAVDAVMAGVPTVALDAGTMAFEVTARNIGEVYTPSRDRWATRLAWCQWTMDEIASGAAWESVQPQ